jgi:DNA modification methylase
VSFVVNAASHDAEFFPTQAWATQALLARVAFTNPIWEPAAGDGAMADVLVKSGYVVVASDLCDRGNPSVQSGVDFLSTPTVTVGSVVTNPPFSSAEDFILKAVACAKHRVAMLLRLAFLEGQQRKSLYSSTPLERVLVFRNRLSFGEGNGKIAFAWFIWTHGYRGEPVLGWIDKDGSTSVTSLTLSEPPPPRGETLAPPSGHEDKGTVSSTITVADTAEADAPLASAPPATGTVVPVWAGLGKLSENCQSDSRILTVAEDFMDRIIAGDPMQLYNLVSSNSIQLMVIQPPAWDFRHSDGQRTGLGHESDPRSYVDNIIQHATHCKRILAPVGTLYLHVPDVRYEEHGKIRSEECLLQDQQLLLLPARVATRMQEIGWVLRNEIAWSIPNPDESSGTDGCRTRAHESIFHFVKSTKYYFDLVTAKRLGSHYATTRHAVDKYRATLAETLVAPLVLTSSRPGDLVFTPFMQDGVAVAARRCGRHWLMFGSSNPSCMDVTRRVNATPAVMYTDAELVLANGIKPCGGKKERGN